MDRRERDKIKEIIKLMEPVQPDHELILWENWIKIRQEEIKKLAKFTNRPPADLAMNLLEKIRDDKERKIVLEHAQIETKPSLRGGIWEQPERLTQGCYCMPEYEVQRTATEKGVLEVVEHIGVPNLIQETEKGLAGQPLRKPCIQLDSDYVQYRDKREKVLIEKIKKIDPFRSHIDNLIVIGGKPKPPPKKRPPLPTVSVTQYLNEEEVASVYAVKINNTVLYKDIPTQLLPCLDKMKKESWHENCTAWTYYFKIPTKRAGRSKLFLQNLGTVTLRYCWRKIKKPIPFIPDEVYDQVFCFNKNEDVISPGQSKVLFFTFVSDKPGIFSEFWELSFCNVCFFDTLAEKLVINLYADSVEDLKSIRRKVDALKLRIDRKAIINIVNDLLTDIVNTATSVEPQIYPYKKYFLESELFVMKNPVCFYHQTEVMKMKDLYNDMMKGQKSSISKIPWDLSISTWRQRMMEKEFDDRMKFYDLLKQSHRELIKPWYEGETVLSQKYVAMKWLLTVMADNFDKDYIKALVNSGMTTPADGSITAVKQEIAIDMDPKKIILMRNLFHLYAYEHVSDTIGMCAGVLSSIDLNRWIDFDFCRFY